MNSPNQPHDIDFAVSESVFTSAEYTAYPDVQMYPLVAGVIVPVFNLPELGGKQLVLDQVALAQIFRGVITNWNHTDIRKTQTSEVSTPSEPSYPCCCP